MGADEHQVTRLDAGRHVDESRDPRQRDVRPAAERRAEEGTDATRRSLGEQEEQLATNDDRMNQVVYAAGKLWSGVNTIVRTSNGVSSQTDRSGIAYFIVTPSTPSATSVAGTITKQGYVALGNDDNAMYPSIGVNAAGKGVMTFSISGHHYYPSTAFTRIDAGTAPETSTSPLPDAADRRSLGLRGVRRRRCRTLGRLLRRSRRGGWHDLDGVGVDTRHVRLPAVPDELGHVHRQRLALAKNELHRPS